MSQIRWIVAQENEQLREDIAHEFNLYPIIAQLLINRGLKEAKSIKGFLNPHLNDLLNPFLLQGTQKAVSRIRQALHHEENILIYGDYDVDGITSTALLFSVLRNYSSNIYYYIPDRSEEGYGISQKGIHFTISYHISLIITVDCGITSIQEISQLNDLGIDTILTDHHEPIGPLPSAYTIINPKTCDYPFKELAGVGVAFKLVQALYLAMGENIENIYEHLDLVALGTVADSVCMLGENRILVKYGLEKLAKSNKIGLTLLSGDSYLEDSTLPIMTRDISFGLIPILNATGRIGNPKNAVDLLLTDSAYRAQFLIEQMTQLNEERKKLTQKILKEARKIAIERNSIDKKKILILSSEDWHPGVIGIVASRIVEEFSQPAIIISMKEGTGKGSGRNQGDFDFSKVLPECSELLERYGGHRCAAGITISEQNINLFNSKMNSILELNSPISQYNDPMIDIETMIHSDQINWNLLKALEKMRPFGNGNPQPVFGSDRFPLISAKKVGKNKNHLKLYLGKEGSYFDGIAFQMAEKKLSITDNSSVNIAFCLGVNTWKGKKTIQLMIKDIK